VRARVFVIGLDAATFSLLDPWLEQGYLPNLDRIIKEGARGYLRSTVPYVSSTAWASFMTGKNPGKHGIMDFAIREPGSYDIRLLNANDVQGSTLWTLLSQKDKRLAVINCPVTYPPQEVNGVLVSGMLTPSLRSSFTYPSSLRESLLERVPHYRIEPAIATSDRLRTKRDMAQGVIIGAEAREEATYFLMEQVPDWDFFMLVFIEPDRVQTYLWDDMDPSHPRHDPRSPLRDSILSHYRQLDGIIGGLLEKVLDGRTTVFIISDHGFLGVHRFVYPNKWLEREGYLRVRGGQGMAVFKASLRRLGLAGPTKRLLSRFLPSLALTTQWRAQAFTRNVDWPETRVFWGGDNGFSINVKGREPEGIVEPGLACDALRDEIVERFSRLEDPISGEKVVERVVKREDIYQGPFIERSPDLRVIWKEYPEQRKTYFSAGELWSNGTFGRTNLSGDHALHGILLACGNHIRQRTVTGAEIIDLAPTILHLLDLPVPEDMDGKVLLDCLDDDLISTRPVRCATPSYEESRLDSGYSEEEKETLQERLRGLGYLG
jgi:predicted AlkP superfamily phosphohydrolase/phosphomutase